MRTPTGATIAGATLVAPDGRRPDPCRHVRRDTLDPPRGIGDSPLGPPTAPISDRPGGVEDLTIRIDR